MANTDQIARLLGLARRTGESESDFRDRVLWSLIGGPGAGYGTATDYIGWALAYGSPWVRSVQVLDYGQGRLALRVRTWFGLPLSRRFCRRLAADINALAPIGVVVEVRS